MQGDGNFCIYTGYAPALVTGGVWCSAASNDPNFTTFSNQFVIDTFGLLTTYQYNPVIGLTKILWRSQAILNPGEFLSGTTALGFGSYSMMVQGSDFCILNSGVKVWCANNLYGATSPSNCSTHYYMVMNNDGTFCISPGAYPLDHCHNCVIRGGPSSPGYTYQMILQNGMLYILNNGFYYWGSFSQTSQFSGYYHIQSVSSGLYMYTDLLTLNTLVEFPGSPGLSYYFTPNISFYAGGEQIATPFVRSDYTIACLWSFSGHVLFAWGDASSWYITLDAYSFNRGYTFYRFQDSSGNYLAVSGTSLALSSYSNDGTQLWALTSVYCC